MKMVDVLISSFGDLIGALVAVVALIYAMRQQQGTQLARQMDFHIYIRQLTEGQLTKSDDPIDRAGVWIVVANGTGVPIRNWSVKIEVTGQDDVVILSSIDYGAVPPTSGRLHAIWLETACYPPEAVFKEVSWEFESGGIEWERTPNRCHQLGARGSWTKYTYWPRSWGIRRKSLL